MKTIFLKISSYLYPCLTFKKCGYYLIKYINLRDGRDLGNFKGYVAIIPSKLSIVGYTVKDTIEYIEKNFSNIGEITLFELKVILNELIVNAIKHGNLQDPNKYVKIYAEICHENYALLTIEDEGEGYDSECFASDFICPSSIGKTCNLEESGRGLILAKNLCNGLCCNKKGNTIFIVKKLLKDEEEQFSTDK